MLCDRFRRVSQNGTLISSRNVTRQDFEHVVQSTRKADINPDAYITQWVSRDEAAMEFEHWLKPESGVVKALITV